MPGAEAYSNENFRYSLEKDLEIIQSYIKSRGGLLINKNNSGKIYYLTDDKSLQEETGLIPNGSFEYWWKCLPMGEWWQVNGNVLKSRQSTKGSDSIRFEPNNVENKKGTRIIHMLGKTSYLLKHGSKIKPGIITYTGKGEWITLSGHFAITAHMEVLAFHLLLQPGARKPAFVDNLSIELLKK